MVILRITLWTTEESIQLVGPEKTSLLFKPLSHSHLHYRLAESFLLSSFPIPRTNTPRVLSFSMAVSPVCVTDTARALSCRDSKAATHLKLISVLIIFFTSVLGISSPVLLARYFHGKPLYDKAILVIKCFAAGVILSTSLVHVLPDAYDALSDCQVASKHPWKDFPFAGLVTLIGALLALFVDLTASAHVEHSHGHGGEMKQSVEYTPVGTQEEIVGKKVGELSKVELGEKGGEEDLMKLKQRLVSQVLEIGIIFHSVIIGVTMGMSQNQCTIRPLVAALAFHQIFEGMGLGGCIAQVCLYLFDFLYFLLI